MKKMLFKLLGMVILFSIVGSTHNVLTRTTDLGTRNIALAQADNTDAPVLGLEAIRNKSQMMDYGFYLLYVLLGGVVVGIVVNGSKTELEKEKSKLEKEEKNETDEK